MSQGYNISYAAGKLLAYPLGADTAIVAGGLVALDADGNAVQAADTAGLRVVGRAEEHADNGGGAAGDIKVTVRRGVLGLYNSTASPLDITHVGQLAYVEEADTVAASGANSVVAGIVLGFDEDGRVWVDVSAAFLLSVAVTNASLATVNAAITDLTARVTALETA